MDGGRTSLVISEAFAKDAGCYTVVAKNEAGEATVSCNVSVKGRLPHETSDSEFACSDMEPVVPKIQMPLKDLKVQEGLSVRLDCVIVGQPEPEVSVLLTRTGFIFHLFYGILGEYRASETIEFLARVKMVWKSLSLSLSKVFIDWVKILDF